MELNCLLADDDKISGINIITYYLPTILENNIMLDGFLSRLIAAVAGTEYFLASLTAIVTIEKVSFENSDH